MVNEDKIMHVAETAKSFLKPVYYAFGNFMKSNVLEKNGRLKNLYKGQRCFILGTGSSLNLVDISRLKDEYTFGCNFLFKHKDFLHLQLSFYASIPSIRVMRKISGNIKPEDYFTEMEYCFKNHKSSFFLHSSCKKFIEKNQYLKNHDIYYIMPGSQMKMTSTSSNDLTRGITFMDGVFFFMLAASIYMGFKELYLCGCGYTYQPIQSGHFNEDWTTLDNSPINYRHTIMENFAKHNGVKIFNVVPKSFESPVYEKISWDYVVTKVLTSVQTV